MKLMRFVFVLIPLIMLGLSACAEDADPAEAVPPYLRALLRGDSDAVYQAVCPEWENDAKRDLDAFSGVTGELQDAECQTAGKANGYTLVTCTGTMVLDYNGELRDRPLEGTTYRVKQVDGDWKMCGYE